MAPQRWEFVQLQGRECVALTQTLLWRGPHVAGADAARRRSHRRTIFVIANTLIACTLPFFGAFAGAACKPGESAALASHDAPLANGTGHRPSTAAHPPSVSHTTVGHTVERLRSLASLPRPPRLPTSPDTGLMGALSFYPLTVYFPSLMYMK